MTKICPKCSAENPDTAAFCQNCGEDLKNVKSSLKPTEASSAGKGGWWSKQGTGTKVALGIGGVCCIGLILIIAISGMFAPDATTTINGNDNTTQVAVNNSDDVKANVTPIKEYNTVVTTIGDDKVYKTDTCPKCGANDAEAQTETQTESGDYLIYNRCLNCGYTFYQLSAF
ncbi:MAG: zinc-ribbon domain-containing protein [Methanobacterium sp.]